MGGGGGGGGVLRWEPTQLDQPTGVKTACDPGEQRIPCHIHIFLPVFEPNFNPFKARFQLLGFVSVMGGGVPTPPPSSGWWTGRTRWT